MDRPGVDSQWFYDQLIRLDLTLEQLGKLMEWEHGKPLSKSAVFLMLRGRREMTICEAGRLAQIFSVPIEDIARRMGAPMPKYAAVGSVVELEVRDALALARRRVTLAQKAKSESGRPIGFKRVVKRTEKA